MVHVSTGGCHCGNITTRFASAIAPRRSPVRACQCSFCRKHGVRAVTDPDGAAEITVADPKRLRRYRFGHGATDFLVCGTCGVYVAAVMEDDGDTFATLVVNAFDNQADYPETAEPVSYDGENAVAQRARRRAKWTPTRILPAEGPPKGSA